jgi:hypothetical protein
LKSESSITSAFIPRNAVDYANGAAERFDFVNRLGCLPGPIPCLSKPLFLLLGAIFLAASFYLLKQDLLRAVPEMKSGKVSAD